MTIHIGEMTTEVVAEGASAATGSSERTPSVDAVRLKAQLRRIARDRLRTHAEGYDD